VVSGKKNIREDKENNKCLTVENYLLIRDSPYADELSNYRIIRIESELRFTRKDKSYTLFFLKLERSEANSVKLVGLDGYGIRNKEFLKYTCNLVNKIIEKNNEMSLQNEKE
jgi:hypothetical protein